MSREGVRPRRHTRQQDGPDFVLVSFPLPTFMAWGVLMCSHDVGLRRIGSEPTGAETPLCVAARGIRRRYLYVRSA